MNYDHCDEKGMRFESATVPAAVKPIVTTIWFYEIPATVPYEGWEGFVKPG